MYFGAIGRTLQKSRFIPSEVKAMEVLRVTFMSALRTLKGHGMAVLANHAIIMVTMGASVVTIPIMVLTRTAQE